MNTKSTFSRLQVTVMFEPTRLAPATLHRAYAMLVPAPPRPTGPGPTARLILQSAPLHTTESKGGPDEDAASRALRAGVV
jgi:hypothetical protein